VVWGEWKREGRVRGQGRAGLGWAGRAEGQHGPGWLVMRAVEGLEGPDARRMLASLWSQH